MRNKITKFFSETNRLPVELIVAMYDYDKIGRDDIIAQLRFEITGARVRADKMDWFVLRPVYGLIFKIFIIL